MKKVILLQRAAALSALAIVSACSGSAAVAPTAAGLNNERPTTAARRNPLPSYSNLVPLMKSSAKDYEYVFNSYGTYASIFDYPKGKSQVEKLNGVGGQGCTNVLYGYGKKIVWNIGGPSQVNEYQVPTNKLLKSLSVNFGFPTSCAMNTSGDLAIGNYDGGQVMILKNATGKGTVYRTALDEEFFDGYDSQGNLFADGFTGSRTGFALVELPKGSSKFVSIKTSNSPMFPGSVQWDGTYVTVFDQLQNATYQYTVSGTKATLKHTVLYSGSIDCAQTWLVKGLMYCGDAGNDNGSVFHYPAGGSPKATFTGSFDGPLGVTAAEK